MLVKYCEENCGINNAELVFNSIKNEKDPFNTEGVFFHNITHFVLNGRGVAASTGTYKEKISVKKIRSASIGDEVILLVLVRCSITPSVVNL
jgi:hypothetical protein